MTTIERKFFLEWHRRAYTINPDGNKVFYALSYVPNEKSQSWLPTGTYEIEKFSPTVWTLTHKAFGFADDGSFDHSKDSELRRIGTFRRLAEAQAAGDFDYNKARQEVRS
jgi:hypothetical protein